MSTNTARTKSDKQREIPLVGVEFEGKKITLPAEPEKMKLDDAIEALYRLRDEQETVLQIAERITGWPEDVLVAFSRALREQFGWVEPRARMTWFGPIPPEVVMVRTGPHADDVMEVYEGLFTVPGLENPIQTQRDYNVHNPALMVGGELKKREIPIIKELVQRTKRLLSEQSIYRGKAIRIQVRDGKNIDWAKGVEFIDPHKIDHKEIVLNDDVNALVESSIMAPIRHTEQCRKYQIPLKRGVLLEGRYGVGKTMIAHWTARECVDNGWTYISIDRVEALAQALELAKRYSPAVVFAEDIDRIAESRDDQGNDLLNVIDGVLSKGVDVMTVLTTNHVEKINQAMLRPGRLDAVIRIHAPDAKSVARLIYNYGRGLVPDNENLDQVGARLAGNIPATVREVVERAKLAMISGGRTVVLQEDLMTSTSSMEHHLSLMNAERPAISDDENLGLALRRVMSQTTGVPVESQKVLSLLPAMLQDVGDRTTNLHRAMNEANQNAQRTNGGALSTVLETTNRTEKKIDEIRRASVG